MFSRHRRQNVTYAEMFQCPKLNPAVCPNFNFGTRLTGFSLTFAKEVRTVDYKEIEYSVVQTANPAGWKWTVFLDATRTRTGIAHSRADAVLDAERAIDRVMKDLDRAM
jgi:hypothetical protein